MNRVSPKAYWAVLSIDHDGAGTGDIVTITLEGLTGQIDAIFIDGLFVA